jgi:glutamate synthase (NADPH/NADH) large chain
MAELGFRTIDEMIGRVEVLDVEPAIVHWKAKGLDLGPVLTPAVKPRRDTGVRSAKPQAHGLERALDNRLIELARPAIERDERVHAELRVANVNRTVGTMLSHTIAKAREGAPLADDAIHFRLTGSAGQSFGAWLAKGVTLELEGEANDYVGKGLSGGRLVVYPPRESTFDASQNILVGNVVLYGAISGSAFFRGRAAERFCVRNSGATAVVEGVGDHGCEYMTGGRVLVLGPTGRNFAAGMSGGIAYVWDVDGLFRTRVNMGLVELERVEHEADLDEVRALLETHHARTGSDVAARMLDNFDIAARKLVKVMPTDYKRVLLAQADERARAEAASQGVA